MAITKREFAAKLLFWLLPWPISRALPRAVRIYYFGPAGGPPPGFYDYWGTPGEYWPDMYSPPDPDKFPQPPAGPTNPSDPYTPGPGSGSSPRQPNPEFPYFDDTWWEPNNAPPDLASWDNINKKWDSVTWATIEWIELVPIGGWEVGWRPNGIVIKVTIDNLTKGVLRDVSLNKILNQNNPISYVYYWFDWSNNEDMDYISFYQSDGDPFSITSIRFF